MLRVIAVLVLIWASGNHAFAQTMNAVPLFESEEQLELTLSVNLDVLLADIGEDRVEHPAMVSFTASDGSMQSQHIEVQTRGRYRRNPENCPFPPLRLDFEKDAVDGTLFDGVDKLKLVTHCRTEEADFEQHVLQEYGLYRVFNMLSSQSFRVRLVRMTYRDVTGRHPPLTRNAFLIEDEEHVAVRHDFQAYEVEGVPKEKVEFEQLTLIHLFQYMIGNIDWDVSMLQNLSLIAPGDDGPFSPVPYDFDLAGVIDAPGADDHPRLGPSALRHQLFAGYCGTKADLEPVLRRFREKRTAIYGVYENIPGLAPEQKQATLRFFDRFYRVIDTPDTIDREFIRPCRTRH